jgi:hypothetical protein
MSFLGFVFEQVESGGEPDIVQGQPSFGVDAGADGERCDGPA